MQVSVRVKPGSSRTKVGGSYPPDDGAALIVAVQAPAVDGQATQAALKAVAKALKVPTSQISLVSGRTSRTKVLEIPDTSATTWQALLATGQVTTGTGKA